MYVHLEKKEKIYIYIFNKLLAHTHKTITESIRHVCRLLSPLTVSANVRSAHLKAGIGNNERDENAKKEREEVTDDTSASNPRQRHESSRCLLQFNETEEQTKVAQEQIHIHNREQ